MLFSFSHLVYIIQFFFPFFFFYFFRQDEIKGGGKGRKKIMNEHGGTRVCCEIKLVLLYREFDRRTKRTELHFMLCFVKCSRENIKKKIIQQSLFKLMNDDVITRKALKRIMLPI